MGLRRAGRAVVAASPAANVSQGKRRRHRQPEPRQPREQRCSPAGMGTGGRWGWDGKRHSRGNTQGKELQLGATYFHELLREISSSEGGLGAPRREAGSMKRRYPAAGPAGLGELAKAPVILTSMFWHTIGCSGRMLGCGRLNCIHLFAALGWA